MEEITILSSMERNVKGVQIVILIVGIVIFAAFLTGFIISLCNDDNFEGFWAFCWAIGVCMIIVSAINLKEGQYTEYKVLIDDNVSMTEFCEKYEIIDYDGKILTVKEKTQ